MKKLIKVLRVLLMIILLLAGVGILLYPDFANWVESRRHVGFIQQYNADVALLREAEIAYEFERARIFNAGITDISINDPWGEGANDVTGTAEYYTLLRFGTSGIMGQLEIPRIRVDLPIFHGSTNAVLDRGVGHMPHTSLPIGGYGNHSLLTAHTGMVRARLFTDLIELTYGDYFIVTIAGQRLLYEVDRIDRFYPHQIDVLNTYIDRDLITLITCTPYAVNSHRLLVRGTRIPYHEDIFEDIEPIANELNIRHLAVIGILSFMTLISIFKWIRAKKRKKARKLMDLKHEKEYSEIFGDKE